MPSRSFVNSWTIVPTFATGYVAAAFASSLRFEAKAGRGDPAIERDDFLEIVKFREAPGWKIACPEIGDVYAFMLYFQIILC